MRREWKRFWRRVSALAGAALFVGLLWPADAQKRANELTLARLRPGRSTLADAEKLYTAKLRLTGADTENLRRWWDGCAGRELKLEVEDNDVLQSVTVTSLAPRLPDCTASGAGRVARQDLWTTGRGLGLGHTRQRVLALYGEPESRVPSMQQGRELELFFYAFDGAGADVPQVMEVTLDRGRVVQITLAYPSL